MSACLVTQLFRQKIGSGVDPSLIDNEIFPHLRVMKHPPKMLIQDIQLTRCALGPNDYHVGTGFDHDDGLDSISAIAKNYSSWFLSGNKRPNKTQFTVLNGNDTLMDAFRNVGTIDIVNKLRAFKNPRLFNRDCAHHLIIIHFEETTKEEIRSVIYNRVHPIGVSTEDEEEANKIQEEELIQEDKVFLDKFLDKIIADKTPLRWEVGRRVGSGVPTSYLLQ